MNVEEQFRRFIESFEGPTDLPRLLKKLNVEEVPLEYRAGFVFWKSLSGPSRNLMLDNALGRRLKKRY